MAATEIWSLFSGAMGLDHGLELSGLAPTLAVEVNPTFCDTIRANRPQITLLSADVCDLDAEDLYRARSYRGTVTLMVGGPPCQSFSPGGKRASLADPRGNLIYEYFRLIEQVKPLYFVLENVGNLVTAALRHRPIAERPGKHWNLRRYDDTSTNFDGSAPPLAADERSGSAIRQMLLDVASLGYEVTFKVVDAADYGAPQHRLRFLLLGTRDGEPLAFPAPTHGGEDSGLRPFMSVRDAIYQLRDDPGPHSNYTEAVRGIFSQIPEGANWRSLPPDIQRIALGGAWLSGGGKTGFYRRLSWDKPAPTITGRPNRKASSLCHPEFLRPLSVRECAALQGFPSTWHFSGSMNAQYMQIGNAVPVQLGEAIGRALLTRQSVNTPVDHLAMLDLCVDRLRAAARNKRANSVRSERRAVPLFGEPDSQDSP